MTIAHPRPSILSIATYLPGAPVTTPELMDTLNGSMSDELKESVMRLQIDARHSILKDYAGWMQGKCPPEFAETTTDLAQKATELCLKQSDCDPSQIGMLIALTNTSDYHFPCLGYQLITRMEERFPKHPNVVNMMNQGCSVLLKAFELAHDYLILHPDQKVLITAAEAHTGYADLHRGFHYALSELDGKNPENLIATQKLIEIFLFGDGAVSLLLGAQENKPAIGPFQHYTNLSKEDENLLTISEGRVLTPGHRHIPFYQMSKNVPQRGAIYAERCATELIQQAPIPGLTLQNLDHYLIHTGSFKILNGVCKTFQIPNQSPKTASSYKILNRYGNLSSCSIGFILHDLFMNHPSPGLGLMVSFGAGFSGSAGLLDFQSKEIPILQ